MSLLYQVCAFHWFIKRHWKTSELRTFETMTTRVTVAAVVVVGVGGNLAQFLRFVCTVKFWDLRSGYDELIVPPHYVEWMLHSGSLSNLQLGSRCGHLRIYVLRHISCASQIRISCSGNYFHLRARSILCWSMSTFCALSHITSLTQAHHTPHFTLPQYPRITHLLQQKSEERHVIGGRVREDRRKICEEIKMPREGWKRYHDTEKHIMSMHTWKSSRATAEASLNFTFCTVEKVSNLEFPHPPPHTTCTFISYRPLARFRFKKVRQPCLVRPLSKIYKTHIIPKI